MMKYEVVAGSNGYRVVTQRIAGAYEWVLGPYDTKTCAHLACIWLILREGQLYWWYADHMLEKFFRPNDRA